MRLLALDTATEACSVALLTDHGLISESVEIGRGHAREILGMVDRILAQGGTTLAGLSGIAAGIGPGSFTGVRVGVAVAQGLAFGAGLPVVPVTSLEALAAQAIGDGADRVLACLDARMGEVYWGCFTADSAALVSPVGRPAVGPPAAVRLPTQARLPTEARLPARARPPGAADPRAGDPSAAPPGTAPPPAGYFRGIGRGFAAYPELSDIAGLLIEPGDRRALPQARDMARLGAARLRSGGGIDPEFLEPLYLRDRVALTEAERREGSLLDK